MQPSGKGATCILRTFTCFIETFKMVKICIQLEVFVCVVLLHLFALAFIWDIKISIHLFIFTSDVICLFNLSVQLSFYLWLSTSVVLQTIVKSDIKFSGFFLIVFYKHLTVILERRIGQREGQPRCQGVANKCSAPTANLSAHSWNLQNIKYKYTDRRKERATPYSIHVVHLLNRSGWTQLMYKNVCIHPEQDLLCVC